MVYKKINDLMKASNTFNVVEYENIVMELEELIGKEVDRSEETTKTDEILNNIKEKIIKALEGDVNLGMLGAVEQIIMQGGNEYRAFKQHCMLEGISFFIEYLDQAEDDNDDDVEDEIDEVVEK